MSTLNPNILMVPQGQDACGVYRIINPAHLMQEADTKTTLTSRCDMRAASLYDVMYTQRICSEASLKAVKNIKDKTGIKVIVDFDDLVWDYKDGYGLPEYNVCKDKIHTAANREALLKYGNEVIDVATCTNEYLKEAISEFIDPRRIKVLPNRLPVKEWPYDKATTIPAEDIYFYAGSVTHYDPINHKPGDFSNGWVNFLKNKKVAVMGAVPYFINPIVNFKPTAMNTYSKAFCNNARQCKFVIAPLADNVFNKCKSNLKYLESCAAGRVCLVTDFEGSPYHDAHEYQKIPVDATAQTIEYIVERAKKHYGEILQYQYEYLKNYWLDSHLEDYKQLLR